MVSCEKDITLDLPQPIEKIVVEGWIEKGEPPFVILTRSSPYFGGIAINDLSEYYVHNALVTVSDGTVTDTLMELCLSNFPGFEQQLASAFGIPLTDVTAVPEICIYTSKDIFNWFATGTAAFTGKENTVYSLQIESNGEVITAKNRLRNVTTVDSLSWEPHASATNDTLVSLYVHFQEPPESGNYLRYFTKRNSEKFWTPRSGSVFDDKFFNAQYFSLPLERGDAPYAEIDWDTYSYFWRGDTIILKWCHIDKAHYDFWRTLEYQLGSGGPYAAPTVVRTNIDGGLGVWGAYACSYDTLIVPGK